MMEFQVEVTELMFLIRNGLMLESPVDVMQFMVILVAFSMLKTFKNLVRHLLSFLDKQLKVMQDNALF